MLWFLFVFMACILCSGKSEIKAFDDLYGLTKETVMVAMSALDDRAFKRYNIKKIMDIKRHSYLFDIVLYFHPACRTLQYLKPIMKQFDATGMKGGLTKGNE